MNGTPVTSQICCKEMIDCVQSGDIEETSVGVTIHGKPEFVDDGDDRMDDMTGSFIIRFCPFCGVPLRRP